METKGGSRGIKSGGVRWWRSEVTGSNTGFYTGEGPSQGVASDSQNPNPSGSQAWEWQKGSEGGNPRQGQGHNVCHLLPPKLLPQEHCL